MYNREQLCIGLDLSNMKQTGQTENKSQLGLSKAL